MNTATKKRNKLFKYIEKTDDQKDVALVIDLHNLMYRCIFISNKEEPLTEKYTFWKYLIMANILNDIQKYKAKRCIIAMDSSNLWRRGLYDDYKRNRKGFRDSSVVNFERFFPVAESFFEDFRETFTNIPFLRIDSCEADDIIAILTKKELQNYKIINISTDGDLHQLKKYKNYHQFDPIKKKFVGTLNHKKELLLKILMGDKSDNIPAIKPKTGPVKAQKMLEEGLENVLENKEIKSNYYRNKLLIDLDMIPYDIEDKILEAYKNIDLKPYNGIKVFNFFLKHRLNYFLDKLSQFSPCLKRLQ